MKSINRQDIPDGRVALSVVGRPAASGTSITILTATAGSQIITVPTTAKPAPTGQITLPIQFTTLRNAPSGCAAV